MKLKEWKKILTVMAAGTAVLCLAACGSGTGADSAASDQTEESEVSQSTEETSGEEETTAETVSEADAAQETTENTDEADAAQDTVEASGESGALVAYFSWSGNTEAVAQEIANQTGADLFEIVPAEPYTDDYDTLLDIARQEQSSDARPAIADTVDLSGYDTVYLGFPNWWGDMPMILYTFLDEYDLAGKTLAPFNTSGGSGFSGSLETIAQMEPDAKITDGLTLGSDEAENCADAVSEWLGSIGLAG